MMRLRMVREQIKDIEQERLRKLTAAPAEKGPPAMVRFIARIIGIGIETADMLVSEILSRGLRDSKAVARYAGLTGAPDESGGAMVSGADCRRPRRHAQEDDRGAGEKAADCTLAHGDDGRDPGGRLAARGYVKRRQEHTNRGLRRDKALGSYDDPRQR